MRGGLAVMTCSDNDGAYKRERGGPEAGREQKRKKDTGSRKPGKTLHFISV